MSYVDGPLAESEKEEAFRIASQIESLLSGLSQEKRSRVMYAFNILFSELGKDLRSAVYEKGA